MSQVVPFPVACYNFDGSLANDDPSAGISDLEALNTLGTYETGAGVCYGKDSLYVFDIGDGLNLSKNNLPSQTYSLELLFQFTSIPLITSSGRRRILRFKAENDAGLYLDRDNRLVFQYGNSAADTVKGATIIPEGNWMNISISRDGTTVPPQIIIYLDGKEEIRIDTDNSTELLNDFKIFADNSGGDPFYKDENASGKVDYLRFYDQALDATTIDDLFLDGQIKSDILITASPDSIICLGETIILTASGGDGTYNWNTGETTTFIIVNPLVSTDYWVESTIQSPCDRKCFKTRDSLSVTVNPIPTPTVAVSSPACINNPVTLSYIGSADILTGIFNWNFAGGSAVNTGGQTYDVTWNSAGTKNITLNVSENGCSSDTLFSVQINAPPTSTFSSPASICSFQPAAISYTGTGTSAATYTWDFDGGTATNTGGQNYTVLWGDFIISTKTISLTVTENGCSSTTTQTITVYPTPTSTFTLPTGVCIQDNLSVTYTGTADPLTASFNWNFDGATATQTAGTQNYSLNWLSGGTKTITLDVTENGCTSTQTVATVNVNNVSSFTITSDQGAICDTGTILVSFTGSYEPLATLNWNFNGGTATPIAGTDNYTVTWPTTGSKTVTLDIIGDLCPNVSSSENITIFATPTSDFSLGSTIVCLLDPITISYTGTASSAATYTWNFDGGVAAKGTGESYAVYWDAGGVKNISLTVTENGCTSLVTTQTVTVNNDSNFDVSVVDQSCITAPVTVTFVGSAETGATFSWDFGTDSNSTRIGSEVYEVTWTSSGVKNISLTINGVACPDATTTKTITIGAVPILDFSSPPQVCADQAGTVMYNGVNTIGKSLSWDFGDASSIDSIAYEHYNITWTTTGLKTINVTINDYGCVQSTTLQVEVLPAPTSLFTIGDFVCTNINTPISYAGTGTSAATYTWNFDGGTASTTTGLENYDVNWSTLGTKHITLSVTENNCTSLVYTDSITVVAPETFIITANNDIVCEGDNNLMTFEGVAETGAIFLWNFDDGLATQINGQEIYDVNWATPGIKNITLVVIGTYCVSDTISKTVTVLPKPNPAFVIDPAVCINLAANIDYLGVPDPTWVFNWSFDGGVPSALGNEDYTVIWNTGGYKIISLSINNSGCITEVFKDTIQVNNYAQFAVTPDQDVICAGEVVNFEFIGSREAGATLTWNFGGGTSTMVTPEEYNVVWSTTGQKSIVLTVNGITCPDSDTTRIIDIKNKPTPTFSSPSAICLSESANIVFTGQADAGSTFNWSFDNGTETQVTGLEEYNVSWPDIGSKIINLQINNNNGNTTSIGCLSDLETDTVNVLDFTLFNTALDSICANEILTVDFSNNDLTSSSLVYTWNFDGADFVIGSGLGPYNLSWSNTNFGNKTINLDIQGLVCGVDSLVHNVYVEENLVPSLSISVDSIYCTPNDVLILPSAINEGIAPEYRWFLNNQYFSTGPSFSYNNLVNGDIVFGILASSIECVTSTNVLSNSVTIQISDFAFQGSLAGVPNPICPGDSSLFTIDTNYAGIQWQESVDGFIWGDILNEVNSQFTATPNTETYYRVLVTDSICTDISPSTLLEIIQISPIEAGEDRTLREGYSIELKASNGTNFIWTPSTGLNDSTIYNPVASPIESITYYVTGSSLEGCPDTDSLEVIVTPKLGIPNTFTPNGDGANDTWVINSINKYPNAQVDIYNRWGKPIFNSLGYFEPWDGRFNSQNLAESTYYYVIDLKDGFPQLKGSITILR